MGVEFFLLKATIVGLMAQRLVRKLCPYCSVEAEIPEEIRKKYDLNNLIERHEFVSPSPKKAIGCPKCNYTGYRGRTVIAEVIPFDNRLQAYFEKDRNFNDPSALGYRTMLEDGLLKVLEGITSFDEVLRVVY